MKMIRKLELLDKKTCVFSLRKGASSEILIYFSKGESLEMSNKEPP